MSGVDVLAVLDRAKSVLLLCDPLVRSQMPPLMNSLEAQSFNARAEIDEARAAVAELIEVCDELHSLRGDPRPDDWSRLYFALSRVRGAE